jgi:hypothetical protein
MNYRSRGTTVAADAAEEVTENQKSQKKQKNNLFYAIAQKICNLLLVTDFLFYKSKSVENRLKKWNEYEFKTRTTTGFRLLDIMDELRDKCPWDKKANHAKPDT